MIEIISIYNDVAIDNVNKDENGYLSFDKFNRLSKRAELRLLDYLTGDIENIKPPIPYLSQKNKDWLSPFIVPKPDQVLDGYINKPTDYYGFENLYRIGSKVKECESDDEQDDCNSPIELLDGAKFNDRCKSDIEECKPSMENPISKMVGNKFQFAPKDLGSITLEYVRYPVFGFIKSKTDTVYNKPVADVAASQNYEWGEFAREILVWFITDTFAIHTRETALKQQNSATGKLVRDIK